MPEVLESSFTRFGFLDDMMNERERDGVGEGNGGMYIKRYMDEVGKI